MLGRVIEVVSRENLDRYLEKRIFTPLDMVDTSFLVPEAKRERVATIYRAVGDKPLAAEAEAFWVRDAVFGRRRPLFDDPRLHPVCANAQ